MVSYRYCVVPLCKSTTIKTPEKIFFCLPKGPKDVKIRKKWLKLMKHCNPLSNHSAMHLCQDHFDIESDTENLMQYRLMGPEKVRLRLKKGVLPHKFDCQKQPAVVHKAKRKKHAGRKKKQEKDENKQSSSRRQCSQKNKNKGKSGPSLSYRTLYSVPIEIDNRNIKVEIEDIDTVNENLRLGEDVINDYEDNYIEVENSGITEYVEVENSGITEYEVENSGITEYEVNIVDINVKTELEDDYLRLGEDVVNDREDNFAEVENNEYEYEMDFVDSDVKTEFEDRESDFVNDY